MRLLTFTLSIWLLSSCGSIDNTTNTDNIDEYEMVSTVFEGNHSREDIKPLVDKVLKMYDMPVNRENVLKISSAILDLKKESAVGVTEMDILKHIYQKGDPSIDFVEQVVISFNVLERSK